LQGHLVLTKRGGLWATSKKRLCRIAVMVGALVLSFCQLPMAQASLDEERIAYPRFSNELNEAIEQASERYGVPESALRAFAAIESGGRAHVSTGSYHGVFQLSHGEFRKYGGRGSIFDVRQNTDAAARKLRAEIDLFDQRNGRGPTAVELYLMHQQGIYGAALHLSEPDDPAWQNMHQTGEGKKRGAGWARKAIWGNVPSDERARFPAGVESITSRQFIEIWTRKMERFGGDVTTPIPGSAAIEIAAKATSF
jgi:Transglycosylase SLT domain